MSAKTDTNTEETNSPRRSRRGFFAAAAQLLGFAVGLLLAIPGVAFLLDPLRSRSVEAARFRKLPVSFRELPEGEPRAFPVFEERDDAWVKYPSEPVGTVWLIRQPSKDADGNPMPPRVMAFTAECPHLGCAIALAGDRRSFFCPCHQSAFTLEGTPKNSVPPRGMDTLEVESITDENARIGVRFERFRTQSTEKIPLA